MTADQLCEETGQFEDAEEQGGNYDRHVAVNVEVNHDLSSYTCKAILQLKEELGESGISQNFCPGCPKFGTSYFQREQLLFQLVKSSEEGVRKLFKASKGCKKDV